MDARKVVDEDGRTWDCKAEGAQAAPGRDVSVTCSTTGLKSPLRIMVSWQWMKMADKGLARIIAAAAPEFA
jgi:hypothetical protein